MKVLCLATTALYLTIASVAFADSNTLDITQASVGTAAPSANFTQSGTSGFANISQTGLNTITGVQLGTGTQLTAVQQNSTSGTVNAINYTGRGNSNVTVNQYASNGALTASGSAGNTANIDVAGTIAGDTPNKLALNQIGYNNTATVYDSFAGLAPYPTTADNISVTQFSDNTAAGNKLQVVNNGNGVASSLNVLQQGGNVANISYIGGVQSGALTQTNTADNAALANTANITFAGAGFTWTQTGTQNNLTASLGGNSVNAGLNGFQTGTGNQANVTQTLAYLDSTTGKDVLDQTGTDNSATATQTSTHDSRFSIVQNGVQNAAYVTQSGTGNIGNLTQTGNLNTATLTQTTNMNTASITQSGIGATAIIHQ